MSRRKSSAIWESGRAAKAEKAASIEEVDFIAPYMAEIEKFADLELIAGLVPGRDKREARSKAILAFSALVGAMSLARAVSDEALSHEILKTVADLLKHPA